MDSCALLRYRINCCGCNTVTRVYSCQFWRLRIQERLTQWEQYVSQVQEQSVTGQACSITRHLWGKKYRFEQLFFPIDWIAEMEKSQGVLSWIYGLIFLQCLFRNIQRESAIFEVLFLRQDSRFRKILGNIQTTWKATFKRCNCKFTIIQITNNYNTKKLYFVVRRLSNLEKQYPKNGGKIGREKD